MNIEQACQLVAEKIMGWKYITYKTGGMSVGGTPHWIDGSCRKMFGSPKHHLFQPKYFVELMEALRAQHRFVYAGYEFNMATGEIIAGAAISPIRIFSYNTKANGDIPAEALVLAAAKLAEAEG